MPKPLVGTWELSDDLKFVNATTAVLPNEEHEGPVFKFPAGQPPSGAVVAVFHGFDVCKLRGENNHRPRVKIELRVKPFHNPAEARQPVAVLRIGNDHESRGYLRFWIDDGLYLYADNGVPFSECAGCGKRFPVAEAETHCQFIPPSYNETMADWADDVR